MKFTFVWSIYQTERSNLPTNQWSTLSNNTLVLLTNALLFTLFNKKKQSHKLVQTQIQDQKHAHLSIITRVRIQTFSFTNQ